MGIVSRKIKKKFKNNEVLKGLSFSVNQGNIVFLLGPNGSGKTTWIRIALGLETKDSGDITFDGKKLEEVRDKISVVFDEPPIYPHLSGYDNLKILSGKTKINDHFTFDILSALNLTEELLQKKAKGFSLGQRHRLAVACALIRQGQYIIMDEPTVGLDYHGWEAVKKLLIKEKEKGKAILVTGHNYDLIEEIVDRLVIIANGVAVFNDTFENFKKLGLTNVTIKSKEDNVLRKYNYIRVKGDTYQKKYGNKKEFEEELLLLQKEGVLIEDIEVKAENLKEIYKSFIEGNN
ncbi:ABC transporter ATP-binding protein [Anaerobranca gottschalkii]|uniref:ABC-2 type transport system ATP-binding protein n=1 Tax=Anaerobranca gottschalkii DSM 13577 TaxID=1120990 RepID=A0A1I0CPL0_9FIRM|nr:ABC transporter ATP-binding protein [Anaerobranca gottschalkii]SET21663.1 ABC-2 type transport system ATP-binding protein [Anaerobranca gottschalkii DSM 13577]